MAPDQRRSMREILSRSRLGLHILPDDPCNDFLIACNLMQPTKNDRKCMKDFSSFVVPVATLRYRFAAVYPIKWQSEVGIHHFASFSPLSHLIFFLSLLQPCCLVLAFFCEFSVFSASFDFWLKYYCLTALACTSCPSTFFLSIRLQRSPFFTS